MLRLSLSINRIGRSSLELNVTGKSGGEVRVQATLTVVFASLKNHRSVPISDDMRARLERYVVPPPG
jgi:4-hydroxybenzoyl-CoA thioesterase